MGATPPAARNESALPPSIVDGPPPPLPAAIPIGGDAASARRPKSTAGSGMRDPLVDFRRQELDAEFGRRRPLRDWLIISALSLTLAAVMSGRSLLAAVWSDHSGISLCIGIIFVIAFGKSLLDVLLIDREYRKTDEQIRLLWQVNNVKAFLDRAKPGIFRHHVANLVTIYRRDDHIQQDNLIELVHARLKARVRPLEVAASIMVSVGLVGTIVGLIASVGGLGHAMQNAGEDQAGLMSGMNTTLGGMGVAFSATLMGSIFGGVILRLIYTNVNGQVEHLVAHIAEIAEVHILPVLRDAARERRAIEAAAANAQATSVTPHRPAAALAPSPAPPARPSSPVNDDTLDALLAQEAPR